MTELPAEPEERSVPPAPDSRASNDSTVDPVGERNDPENDAARSDANRIEEALDPDGLMRSRAAMPPTVAPVSDRIAEVLNGEGNFPASTPVYVEPQRPVDIAAVLRGDEAPVTPTNREVFPADDRTDSDSSASIASPVEPAVDSKPAVISETNAVAAPTVDAPAAAAEKAAATQPNQQLAPVAEEAASDPTSDSLADGTTPDPNTAAQALHPADRVPPRTDGALPANNADDRFDALNRQTSAPPALQTQTGTRDWSTLTELVEGSGQSISDTSRSSNIGDILNPPDLNPTPDPHPRPALDLSALGGPVGAAERDAARRAIDDIAAALDPEGRFARPTVELAADVSPAPVPPMDVRPQVEFVSPAEVRAQEAAYAQTNGERRRAAQLQRHSSLAARFTDARIRASATAADLRAQARQAADDGWDRTADDLRRQAGRSEAEAHEYGVLADAADRGLVTDEDARSTSAVIDPETSSSVVTLSQAAWNMVNSDENFRDQLHWDGPTDVRYNEVGGLRRPLRVHYEQLMAAIPRDANGRPMYMPDPRDHGWFGLVNDGGHLSDPARAINCGDNLLALLRSLHADPTLSSPRTADGYLGGHPDRLTGPEVGVVARIQRATNGIFQGICADVSNEAPRIAEERVRDRLDQISEHIRRTDHGSTALVISQHADGSTHAWMALNLNGTIIYLDPTTGQWSDRRSLYGHDGDPENGENIVSMDVLTLDGRMNPTTMDDLNELRFTSDDPSGLNSAMEPSDEDAPDSQQDTAPDMSAFAAAESAIAAARDQVLQDLPDVIADLSTTVVPMVNGKTSDFEAKVEAPPSERRTPEDLAAAYEAARMQDDRLTLESFLGEQMTRYPVVVTVNDLAHTYSTAVLMERLRGLGYGVPQDFERTAWSDRNPARAVVRVSHPLHPGIPVELHFPVRLTESMPDVFEALPRGDLEPGERFSVTPEQVAAAMSSYRDPTSGWRTALCAHVPLPRLGGDGGLPVRRDADGLISEVMYDETWMDVPAFTSALADTRVQTWKKWTRPLENRDRRRLPPAEQVIPIVRRGVIQPCVTVAVDRRTGLITEGHNKMGIAAGRLHPLIRRRLEAYNEACARRGVTYVKNDLTFNSLHYSIPGTHAEIYAVNELLWLRAAAGIEVTEEALAELRIDNRAPDKTEHGTGKACCANCTGVIWDVPCNNGKLLTSPSHPAGRLEE